MTTAANIKLLEAARAGNLGEVKAALEAGADINTHESNEESYTALHLAAMNGKKKNFTQEERVSHF